MEDWTTGVEWNSEAVEWRTRVENSAGVDQYNQTMEEWRNAVEEWSGEE